MERHESSELPALRIKEQTGTMDYETSERDIAVVTTDRGQQDRAVELLDTAMQQVESGVSATYAVAAMRELAPSPEDADFALGLLRLEYFPFDLHDANTAWRYLVAIKHDVDVKPLAAEESSRIERMEFLSRLEPDQAFDEVKVLVPQLGDVEIRVLDECDRWDGSDLEHDGFLRIDGMLTPLLGPESNQTDPVLRSRFALHIVRNHLIKAAKLLD
jgi:hypothetical protein